MPATSSPPSGNDHERSARSADITAIIRRLDEGDESAREELFSVSYHELRRIAGARMADERADHTLQPTALVHEVFVRLMNEKFESRAHFFFACARAMRQLVIEYARKRGTLKRGGDRERVELDFDIPGTAIHEDLIALDEVIDQLAARYPRKADIVLLHQYAGLTVKETAALLGCSRPTVEKEFSFGKAWLRSRVNRHKSAGDSAEEDSV